MKDKILIKLAVPEIEEEYDIYIPINKKIGNVIKLLNKAVFELSNGLYVGSTKNFLYDSETGTKYDLNAIIKDTNVRNGSRVVLF